jgi:Stage II sporulation protein E (SpoIIE)
MKDDWSRLTIKCAPPQKSKRPFSLVPSSSLKHVQIAVWYAPVYLYLDAVNGTFRYSAGAHPPQLLWRRSRQALEKLEVTGLLLGVRTNEPYAESEFSFEIGDRLLLYTDGPLEAEDARGQSFGDTVPTFIQENKTWEPSNSPIFC